jgi:hypothetical protein
MPPAFPSPRRLPPEETTRALLREPDVERFPAGRRGEPPHAFIDVREHRLDLWIVHFRERSRGRVRSFGFCRSMSPRARLWTTRTSPTAGCAIGATAWSIEVSRSRAITEWARGQGQRNTAPRRSPRRLLVTETSPQPRPPSGASCRGHLPFTLPGAARGEGDTAIVRQRTAGRRGALAGQRRREGRATPGFREEARCSPARGTFHQKVVRERTKAADGQRAGRPRRRRLFHWPGARAGGRPRGTGQLGQSGAETGEPASFFDRPQRPF